MGFVTVLLLVMFVLVSVLLILIVLVQGEEGDTLGGLFAGGSGSAFGSRSGNILTKTTSILGALFLILAFSLALVNRSGGDRGLEATPKQIEKSGTSEWWNENTSSQSENNVVPATPESGAPLQTEQNPGNSGTSPVPAETNPARQ
ncbi:MAG TPA: preprotein translocase subunit SecG [Termitinemataceae bacterium]|nr:preprotein translocase subunit SecG [Termitinemataceae bacterium]HOM23705.1 preprotein translocase subunit SecG [Termitinemataceae bacterium]HPQ00744.1 preprotein translocase subunit SecG [Termitinemataceae bacterium]